MLGTKKSASAKSKRAGRSVVLAGADFDVSQSILNKTIAIPSTVPRWTVTSGRGLRADGSDGARRLPSIQNGYEFI
jgi:hypothetical protein